MVDETNQQLLNDPNATTVTSNAMEASIPQIEENGNRDLQFHIDPMEEDEGFALDEANLQINEVLDDDWNEE